MGAGFTQTLEDLYLPLLKTLWCGLYFDHPLPDTLEPKSLEILKLNQYYIHPLPESWELSSLKRLRIGLDYNEEFLKGLNFSSSVKIERY